MGFSSEIQLITKEEDEIIEIYPSDTENSDNTASFTIEYLFNHVISEDVTDASIDISKITVLELSKCNLTDIPIACKKLNLKHLGLSHNCLNQVPLCLYNGLKHLESLDLSHNCIQNFDMEPDCLPFVRKMKLNNNAFQNIPKWFLMFKCTNMEEFNYSFNKAKHYKHMKNSFNLNLLKLKKLELVCSCLIDQDFNLLKSFRELQYLDISNREKTPHINRFEDVDDLFVKPKWKELNVLKLEGLSISLFPEGIPWIESLKELHISNNNLSWVPDGIEFLVNLEVLILSDNNLVSFPNSLSTIEKLIVLKAPNNSLESVPDFSSMLNLKTLDLFNNSLDTVSFNVNTLDLVDIEYNYCDTSKFQNFSLYEEKKNRLRKVYCTEERYNGPKIREPEDLDDTCSEKDIYYYFHCESSTITYIPTEEEKNWDLPPKVTKTCSDIDSEDDKWRGEPIKSCSKKTCETKRVYISDDDWMFEDCCES